MAVTMTDYWGHHALVKVWIQKCWYALLRGDRSEAYGHWVSADKVAQPPENEELVMDWQRLFAEMRFLVDMTEKNLEIHNDDSRMTRLEMVEAMRLISFEYFISPEDSSDSIHKWVVKQKGE